MAEKCSPSIPILTLVCAILLMGTPYFQALPSSCIAILLQCPLRPLALSSHIGYILLLNSLIVPRNRRCISTVLLQRPLPLSSPTALSHCSLRFSDSLGILSHSCILVLSHSRPLGFSGSQILRFSDSQILSVLSDSWILVLLQCSSSRILVLVLSSWIPGFSHLRGFHNTKIQHSRSNMLDDNWLGPYRIREIEHSTD